MFIATQQKYIPAPAEPNVVAVTHGAPLERESIREGAINIWPLRGQIPPTNTLLPHHEELRKVWTLRLLLGRPPDLNHCVACVLVILHLDSVDART